MPTLPHEPPLPSQGQGPQPQMPPPQGPQPQHPPPPPPPSPPSPPPPPPPPPLSPPPDPLLSEWQTCRALEYPRSLAGLLTAGEARALAAFYHRYVHPRTSSDATSIYGHVLEAGLQRVPGSELVFDTLNKLWLRTAERLEIGPREFVIATDFFSFRSPDSVRLFPGWHQDYAFWMTGAQCTGFNLWILLDHSRLNQSFDIYDVGRVPQLYQRVYERAVETSGGAESHGRSYPGAGSFLSTLQVRSEHR